MLTGNNPDDLFNTMMQNNPQFKAFVEANKGKTADQIAMENNIDISAIRKLI